MAFGFSVLLLGSSSLSVPTTYACRKGAGFCQAAGRKAAKRGRTEARGYHRSASCVRMGMTVPVREGVGDRLGSGGGASGGGPPWCVAGLEKLPGSRRPVVVVAMDGLGWLCAWMDALDWTTGRLLEAERWVQRRAFRRERCSERGGRNEAQSGAEQSGQGDCTLAALVHVHDEFSWLVFILD
jgi:hypothetical protein